MSRDFDCQELKNCKIFCGGSEWAFSLKLSKKIDYRPLFKKYFNYFDLFS